MDTKKEVFISYAKGDNESVDGKRRMLISNEVYKALNENGFSVVIDFDRIGFKDNIKEFIKTLGKSKYVVLIISDKYLKSHWCMIEVAMLFEHSDFRQRIFPIVLEEVKINDPLTRVNYIVYWQDLINELEERLSKIRDMTVAMPILVNLTDYKKIHGIISTFIDTLDELSILRAEEQLSTNFNALLAAIREQIERDRDELSILKQEYDELKREFDTLKTEYNRLLDEHQNTELKYNQQLEEIKQLQDKEILNIQDLLDEMAKKVSNLESENAHFREEEEKRISIVRLEEKVRLDEEFAASQPYNILNLKVEATADDINKQYLKLKKQYEDGINSSTKVMKPVYEKELEKLENAYSEIYQRVKDEEDKVLDEAYSFLNLDPGVNSYEIRESYRKQKKISEETLETGNKALKEAALENVKKLESSFQILYKIVHSREVEEENRIASITPPNMVYVNGGRFQMKDKDKSGIEVVREVSVDSFFIDKYPLMVKEFREFCQSTNYRMPEPPGWGWKDDHPMVNITWREAFLYALWADKRLPTEAEWEFAARGGIKSKMFTFSGSNKLEEVGWFKGNSENTTNPVGYKKPNELGIFDMSGNVWEWCFDWYDEYFKSNILEINPTGPVEGDGRVLRGGCFKVAREYCNIDRRMYNVPDSSYETWGVRFVRNFSI